MKKNLLISILILIMCFHNFEARAFSPGVFRLINDNQTTGTAFIINIQQSFFSSRAFIVTAAHTVSSLPPDQVFLEIGTQHTPETINICFYKLLKLLRQNRITLPETVNSQPVSILDYPWLKDKVCAKFNCKNLSANYLNAELSILPFIKKNEAELSTEQKKLLRIANGILIDELFPDIFTKRPRLVLRGYEILSLQDDLAILFIENPELINNHKAYNISSDVITPGMEVDSLNYGVFNPFITQELLYGNGHVCSLPENSKFIRIWLAPLNNGSSGAPVFLKNEDRVLGVVLSQIVNNEGVSTDIYNVLHIQRVRDLISEYISREKKMQNNQGNSTGNPAGRQKGGRVP